MIPKNKKDIKMTWKELKAHIEVMDEQQANTDVTIHTDEDEFFPVVGIDFSEEDDVLDKNHPYLDIEMTVPKL
jgi:Mlc titration factor MtfA (ptsG expression regulator)